MNDAVAVEDPLTGGLVLLPPEGSHAKPTRLANASLPCPFCPAAEAGQPNHERAQTAHGAVSVHDNPWPLVPAGHRVLVLEDAHVDRAADVSAAGWDRMLEVGTSSGCDGWTFIGANLGPLGGASVPHVHAQLVTLPEPAPACLAERPRLRRRQGCALCQPERLGTVSATFDDVSVLVPERGGEILIAPAAHAPTAAPTAGFGQAMAWAWEQLTSAGWPDGQIAVHHLPDQFHWHAHLTPMLGPVGCIERGTGFAISRLLPDLLRAALAV